MRVYLVRHAESITRPGQSDAEKSSIGLSDLGKIQASATAKKINTLGIKRIISSPLTRAKETADFISRHVNLPVETDDRLREFFTDPDEKDSSKQKALKKLSYSNPTEVMPGGESLIGAVERLEDLLNELRGREDGAVCLVTHRVIVESLLSKNFDISAEVHERLRPASISCLELRQGGDTVIFYNQRPLDINLAIETLKRKIKYWLTG